jgi:hypothetical protein
MHSRKRRTCNEQHADSKQHAACTCRSASCSVRLGAGAVAASAPTSDDGVSHAGGAAARCIPIGCGDAESPVSAL